MSIEKTWQLAPKAPSEFLQQFANLESIVIQLLYNRDLKDKNAIVNFLNPDYKTGLYDPFLIQDMKKAIDRIFKAIQKKEKIVIYGDYDADGITSTALLYKTLKFLGAENLKTYIPHRQKEGYGLHKKSVRKFKKQKTHLIITVDCGITNVQQVAEAKKLNMDVIITDHHEVPPKLPSAYAILNVKRKDDRYPFKGLAGVGVAFKLAQALLSKAADKLPLVREAFEKWLLDLVAIGTIADLAPLLDENRALVKYGLIILNQSKRWGLKKLYEQAGLKPKLAPLNTYNIGYQIAPRLNAAGRMEHANAAYNLLLTESELEAEKLASELETTNRSRQKLTAEILEQAKEQIGDMEEKMILLASHPAWSSGIAGLVAGKICDEYSKPTLIIERGEKQSTGSARSIENFNITKALAECEEFLIRYGGHKTAAGFTLETAKISLFYQKLEKIARQEIGEELKPTLLIEAELNLSEVNEKTLEQIEKFQPFGEANPVPRFLARKISVVEIRGAGAQQKHLKLKLKNQNGRYFEAIGFGLGEWVKKLLPGDIIDLVYEILVNEWNGQRKLELKIVDLKNSDPRTITPPKSFRDYTGQINSVRKQAAAPYKS